MSGNLQDKVGSFFNIKREYESKLPKFRQKVSELYSNEQKEYNPFLNKNGEVFNKYIDYQKVLDNPNVTSKAKEYIQTATGLTPSATTTSSNTTLKTPQIKSDGTFKTQDITTAIKNNIVDSATKYMGKPYVWGGESMEEGGFDCSGFVYATFKDAGYDIGRTTAEGYRQKGTPVNKNELQPGDLVFYGGNEATHVGIYVGNGQIIQSSGGSKNTKSNPGKGVCIKNIDYRNDYLGAKRY